MIEHDEVMLAEEVGRLNEERKHLQIEIDTLQTELTEEKRKRVTEKMLSLLLYLIPVIVLTFLAWKVVTTPDVATHCTVRINRNGDGHRHLYGVVPWGWDIDHGIVHSIEDGVKKAQQLGCPLQHPAEGSRARK